MRIIFLILCSFVMSMAIHASPQPNTPQEYADAISKSEAIFKETPSVVNQKNWFALAQEANEKFPNDIKIASLYAYTDFLATGDPANGIKIILPHLHEISSHPEVALALWRIFNNGLINARANKGSFFSAGTPWGALFADCGNPIGAIETMEAYWAKYINDHDVVPARLIPAIKDARKTINSNAANGVWRRILLNINNHKIEMARTQGQGQPFKH